MPSSDHSGFQTLGIFSLMIEVTLYRKSKRFTRVCVSELTSCQEWVVVDSSFCINERYVGKFSTTFNDFRLIVCQGIPMDIVVCKRHEPSRPMPIVFVFAENRRFRQCETIHLKNRGTQHTIVPS